MASDRNLNEAGLRSAGVDLEQDRAARVQPRLILSWRTRDRLRSAELRAHECMRACDARSPRLADPPDTRGRLSRRDCVSPPGDAQWFGISLDGDLSGSRIYKVLVVCNGRALLNGALELGAIESL